MSTRDAGLPSDREERLEQLFHQALQAPAAERLTWLAAHCDDEALRREVSELLGAHDHAPSVLEDPELFVGYESGAVGMFRLSLDASQPDGSPGKIHTLKLFTAQKLI